MTVLRFDQVRPSVTGDHHHVILIPFLESTGVLQHPNPTVHRMSQPGYSLHISRNFINDVSYL